MVASILEVKEELIERSYDDYNEWVENNMDIFKPLDNKSIIVMNQINSHYPDLYKENNRKNSLADIPLVAFAKAHNLVLVTQETYNYGQFTKEKNTLSLLYVNWKVESALLKIAKRNMGILNMILNVLILLS